MDVDMVTGSGGTLVLGGKTLLVRQLTMGAIGQLTAWLKERAPRPYQTVAQHLVDLAPLKEVDPEGYAKERERLLLLAREDAKRGVLADPDTATAIMGGADGIAMMTWLSVRTDHPEITYEWILDEVNKSDLLAIKKKLDEINAAWEKYLPKN